MTTNGWTPDNVPAGNTLFELYFASQAEDSDPDPYAFPGEARCIKLFLTSPLGLSMSDFSLVPADDLNPGAVTGDHYYRIVWHRDGEDEEIGVLVAVAQGPLPEDQVARP
ncbi:hypothetical protein [Mycobacterium phage Maco2]|uniref:Uncharacterized protein n=1 Tax=Mycobacterium phage Maco2 TaxID=2805749 RepID=A0A899IM98_9CAUD|nr:hypothetical protein [Mycobacterium phage Maco2]